VVYGPKTDVIRSGTADYYGSMVGKSLTLSGSGGIHADESLDLDIIAGGGGSARAVLAQ
jgi:hypothetical protein